MNHEQFRELLPLYVVGALDPAERDAFDRYVAANRARCEAEIAEFQGVADALAFAAPAAQPSPDVFGRVLAAIEEKQRPAVAVAAQRRAPVVGRGQKLVFNVRSLAFGWVPWTATALLCVLVVVLTSQLRKMTDAYSEQAALAAKQQNSLSEQSNKISELSGTLDAQSRQFSTQVGQLEAQAKDIETLKAANTALAAEKAELVRASEELRRQVQEQNVQVASLRSELSAQRGQLELMMDPATRVAQLADPKGETKAMAKAYWHAGKSTGWVVASNLPAILKGEGKCLELWAICGNEAPVPAGIGWTDAKGHGVVEIKLAKEVVCVDKFAVTVEPSGGLPIPTGPMLLIGQ